MKRTNQITCNAELGLIVSVMCSLIMVSCTKPVPVAFTNACQKENDNIYVSVEGYLRTGASVFCSSHQGARTCGLELVDSLDGTNIINVYVEVGTGKSQMEPLPNSYGKDDLKIRDREGQVLGTKDRIRVLGIAKNGGDAVAPSYTICYVNVQEIEKP